MLQGQLKWCRGIITPPQLAFHEDCCLVASVKLEKPWVLLSGGTGERVANHEHHGQVALNRGATGAQGRLIDHLRNTQSVGLEDLQALVLDEADRLLQMGFAEEVRPCSYVVHGCLLLCFQQTPVGCSMTSAC